MRDALRNAADASVMRMSATAWRSFGTGNSSDQPEEIRRLGATDDAVGLAGLLGRFRLRHPLGISVVDHDGVPSLASALSGRWPSAGVYVACEETCKRLDTLPGEEIVRRHPLPIPF